MAGLFGTLGTANKGLNAQQRALETTSHNISNANTPGYSRQRVNMEADLPYKLTGVGQIGTGVKVTSISRIVDDFVLKNIRNETSSFHQFDLKSEILGELEGIFNETGQSNGISKDLAVYFDSWTKLSNNPEFDNAKSILVENGNSLTDNINHLAQQIKDLEGNTISSLEKSVLDVNAKLEELQSINSQIYKISNDGSVPNDLLDKRDMILNDVAKFSKIKTSFDQYGRVSVKMDGQDVLTHDSIATISMVIGHDPAGNALVSHGGNSLQSAQTINQTGLDKGQLLISSVGDKTYKTLNTEAGASKGYQDSLGDIKQRLSELNEFAYGLATSVNIIHSDNGKSIDFFDLGSNTDYALNLKINEDIQADPKKS
ncbi:flagellar hook-associated protein FlgK [Vagococcus sp.]|uniref:flagellar hook-associated protein FlgK n=1 Tax=Vagococcus sp. TaxID=1933889 RepID=UPI003F953B70